MNSTVLLHTIAKDLGIQRFEKEPDLEFTQRVIYSAIGHWILSASCDVDMAHSEEEEGCRSRTYITRKCKQILHSYFKLYPEIEEWFYHSQSKEPIRLLTDRYIQAGILVSGSNNTYQLAPPEYAKVSNEVYFVRGDLSQKDTYISGLGSFLRHDVMDESIKKSVQSITKLFPIPEYPAKQYTERFIQKIMPEFQYHGSAPYTREYFNPKYKKPFSESWVDYFWKEKLDVTVYRDKYSKNFGMAKDENGKILTYQLPEYIVHEHETKRLMYGLRSRLNNPSGYEIEERRGMPVYIRFYSALPKYEESIMYLIAWPTRNIEDSTHFTTTQEFIPLIKQMMNHLNIRYEVA